MTRLLFLVAVFLMLAFTAAADAEFSGTYTKKDGSVDIRAGRGDTLRFKISTGSGQHLCDLEGEAMILNKKMARYQGADNCIVIFTFGKKSLSLTTKDCSASCGPKASGSMDGTYGKLR